MKRARQVQTGAQQNTCLSIGLHITDKFIIIARHSRFLDFATATIIKRRQFGIVLHCHVLGKHEIELGGAVRLCCDYPPLDFYICD